VLREEAGVGCPEPSDLVLDCEASLGERERVWGRWWAAPAVGSPGAGEPLLDDGVELLKVKGSDRSASNSPETDWVVPVGWLSPVAGGGDEVGPSAAVAAAG
jgi:hypothetical protein